MTENDLFVNQLVTKSLIVSKDSSERFFTGILTVQMKDKQGEILIVDELMKVLPIWMKRGGFISDTHSNRIIGKGINYAKTSVKSDGTTYQAIEITGVIFKDYKLDDDIWRRMQSGEYRGLSFGGATKSDREPVTYADGSLAYNLKDLEHYEVAVCRDPAVSLALITGIHTIAKAQALAPAGVTYETKDLGNGLCQFGCKNAGIYVVKPEGFGVDKSMVEAGTDGMQKCPYCGYQPELGNESAQTHLDKEHPDKVHKADQLIAPNKPVGDVDTTNQHAIEPTSHTNIDETISNKGAEDVPPQNENNMPHPNEAVDPIIDTASHRTKHIKNVLDTLEVNLILAKIKV